MNQRMTGGDWAVLGALSVLWGGSFLFYRVLAAALPVLVTVTGRVVIAALALAGFLALRGVSLRLPARLWGQFLLLALLNNVVPFLCFAWAETRVTSGTAAILNAVTPICTMLVTCLVLRTETLTGARVVGIGCGVAGVVVLVGPAALLGQDLWGQLACLLATVSYGFGTPYGRRIVGVSAPQLAFGQLAASSAMLLPVAMVATPPWLLPMPSLVTWAALLGLAVLSTSLAYLLFFRLLLRAGATNLTLVTFMIPVSALFLGAALLHEPVTPPALAGMALIACGLAAIDGRVFRLIRRKYVRP